jgi:hypothetical protein
MLLHHPFLTQHMLILQALQSFLVFWVIFNKWLLQLILILLSSLLKFLIDDLFMISNWNELIFELFGEGGFDSVTLLFYALGLLILRGLDTSQSFIHERLVVLLKGRYVEGMLCLELCQLSLTLNLCRLQTLIPFFFNGLHVIFDLLSLLFLHPLALFYLWLE